MNLIIAVLIFLSLPIANAQYFAEPGATWHYSEHFFNPQPDLEYFMKFEVVGDTSINDWDCSVIHKSSKAELHQIVCWHG